MTTPTPITHPDLLAAQQFCQKLWPGAEITFKAQAQAWALWINPTALICIELVGRPDPLDSEASASFGRNMSVTLERVTAPHWKDAILSVAMKLEELAK